MRALIVLAELWAASEIILLAGRHVDDALRYALVGIFLLVCCALSFLVTYPPRSAGASAMERALVPLQLVIVLAIVGVTGWAIAAHSHLAAAPPLWSSLSRHLDAALAAVTPGNLGAALATFAEYALLPLVLLALLRVPLAKMGLAGFARGSAAAAAIWLVLPLFALAYVVLYADASLALAGRRLLYSFFESGFSEEFLFRGALFGRLRAVMPAQWAALTQAILFGVWRLGTNAAHAHGLVPALALVVPAQAAFGYAMAMLVRRTGNLAIPTLFHTIVDTVQTLA